jgi:hypothetical protein
MKKYLTLLLLILICPGLYPQYNSDSINHNQVHKLYRIQKKVNTTSLNENLQHNVKAIKSNVVLLTKDIQLTPNPANDFVKCVITLPYSMNIELSVIDLYGNKTITKNEYLIQGKNEIILDLSILNKGWYLISVNNFSFTNLNHFIIKY